MKLALPIMLILSGLSALLIMAISQGAIPEIQVHQLIDPAQDYMGKQVKLQAILHHIDRDVRPLAFVVRDRERPGVTIRAEVDDVRPDIFKAGNDIAVIGRYDGAKGVFIGTKLFTKCPSKYEASEEAAAAAPYPAPSDVSPASSSN